MSNQDFDSDDFSQKIKDEFQQARRGIAKPNILVAGGTGVGKSSLVNLIFGGDVACTGVGAPVTKGINRYESDNLVLFDAEGYESGEASQARYRETLDNLLKGQAGKPLAEKIHLVWYCVSQGNHRVLEIDTQTVSALSTRDVPVAIVMTQADTVTDILSEDMRETIRKKCVDIPFFETSTSPDLPLDASRLVQWSADHLEQGMRTAFLIAAHAVQAQYKEGQSIIHASVAQAALLAASPIPFSDAPLLMANQARMIAQLSSLWDIEALPSLLGGGLALQLVAQLGRSASGNLMKLLPGVGTGTGVAINVGIASAFTAALGYALNELCLRVTEDKNKGKQKSLSEYFNESMISDLIKSYLSEQKVSA